MILFFIFHRDVFPNSRMPRLVYKWKQQTRAAKKRIKTFAYKPAIRIERVAIMFAGMKMKIQIDQEQICDTEKN